MKRILILSSIIVLLLSACNQKKSIIEDSQTFKEDHAKWQSSRIERLKTETGWLNLAGLFWLEEGVNTFGSDNSNSIIFPDHFPAYGGEIIWVDKVISIKVNRDITITADKKTITEMTLHHDQEKKTTILSHEAFRWFIIKRGDNFGIRLRDLELPRIEALDHIPSFPLSEEWVIEAEYIAYDSARTIEVPTVISGFSEFYKAPGELRFKKDGSTHTLIPFSSGKGYFLIVGDATNGIDTYGAGRFMYTEQIEGNKVILDFNRATNPPCAFSPYATCPLPPLENILDLPVTAGEKAVHLE